jgi:MarR family transcriptional regulator, organic hydroperoxide resistance regulator
VDDFIPLFTRAAKLMRGAADVGMSRHGVRVGQNLVIDVLMVDDGLTPGELAERLHVTTPTIVKMATRMEAAGLVTRRRDERDARLVRLYLADRARSRHALVEAELKRLQKRATAGLTADERRHLESALTKVIRNLERIGPGADEAGEVRPPDG